MKFTFDDCKLRDLRRIFTGVESSNKILINGKNDFVVKIGDDGYIEFISTQDDIEKSQNENPVSESPLGDTIQNPLSGISEPSEMYIDALNGRKALILEKNNGLSLYQDIIQLIKKYNVKISTVANILVSKKKWRKEIKNCLRRRKRIKQYRSTPHFCHLLSSEKLLPHKNPELPSKENICHIKIPYRGYIVSKSFGVEKLLDIDIRDKFGNACRAYYEAYGYKVYNVYVDYHHVEIAIQRKQNDTCDKSVMDYFI